MYEERMALRPQSKEMLWRFEAFLVAYKRVDSCQKIHGNNIFRKVRIRKCIKVGLNKLSFKGKNNIHDILQECSRAQSGYDDRYFVDNILLVIP